MSQVYTVTGADTLTINNHVFNDLSVDTVVAITYPTDINSRKTGKNGNTIFAQNAQGLNADMEIHLLRGSVDDQFLQGIINTTPTDFPSTQLMNGTFVKRLGDGLTNVTNDIYTLAGGIIRKLVEGKENVAGDTSQAEAIYYLYFASASRSIG